METPHPARRRRRKTGFYRDRHFWSAAIVALLPVLINHLPAPWQDLAMEIYGALAAAGIIAARRHNRTDLGLRTGISSTQPEDLT
jgi:hypothetical protein